MRCRPADRLRSTRSVHQSLCLTRELVRALEPESAFSHQTREALAKCVQCVGTWVDMGESKARWSQVM